MNRQELINEVVKLGFEIEESEYEHENTLLFIGKAYVDMGGDYYHQNYYLYVNLEKKSFKFGEDSSWESKKELSRLQTELTKIVNKYNGKLWIIKETKIYKKDLQIFLATKKEAESIKGISVKQAKESLKIMMRIQTDYLIKQKIVQEGT